MPTLYERYNTGDDSNRAFYQILNWMAQTFTPSVNHIITSVKVKLLRHASSTPGTLTAEIWATDGDGKPTGSALVSGTIDGSGITTTSPGEWKEITLGNGYLLLASTKYALVMKSSNEDTDKPIYWRKDGSDPTYADGSVGWSSDQGGTWTLIIGEDAMFEDWGNPEGSSPGGSILPTDAITRVTNLIHRYNRKEQDYSLEIALGEVTSDFGLPQWLSRPQPSVPEVVAEEAVKEVVKESVQAAIDEVIGGASFGTGGPTDISLEEARQIFQSDRVQGALRASQRLRRLREIRERLSDPSVSGGQRIRLEQELTRWFEK